MRSIAVIPKFAYNDLKTQVATGTAAAITAPTKAKRHENIVIAAHPANDGYVIIGKSTVAADGSAGGFPLKPGEMISLPNQNYTEWYAIASDSSERLMITYQSSAE